MKYFVGGDPKAQAKFLLSLFGYPCEDNGHHYFNATSLTNYQRAILNEMNNHSDWDCYSEHSPSNFHDGKNMFYNLAQVVCTCFSYCEIWRESNCNDVLREIFTTAAIWHRENIAGFLLFCSESLILHFVQEMLFDESDGETIKAASLVIDMVDMSLKFDNELSSKKGMGKVFDCLCAPEMISDERQRSKFHMYLWQGLRNQTVALEINGHEDDALDLFFKFGTHVMGKAYSIPKSIVTNDQSTMEVEE